MTADISILLRAVEGVEPGIGFILLDVGAQGGLPREWDGIADLVRVIGFEPVKDKCEALREKFPQNRYYDTGLWEEQGTVPFYLCSASPFSSILKPHVENFRTVGKLPNVESYSLQTIDVNTIDNLLLSDHGARPDFIKLDTQGTELQILKGGRQVIAESVLGVCAEVEFIELYENQPLFSDVDQFLMGEGFEFMAFKDMMYWRTEEARRHACASERFLSADALYVRKPGRLPTGLDRRTTALKLMIIQALYGYPDLALKELSRSSEVFAHSETSGIETALIGLLRAASKPRFRGKERLLNALARLSGWLDERAHYRIGRR